MAQILKYHFWMLLALALILAIAGWWMATGTMQAATQAKKTEIDGTKKNLESVKPSDVPSKDWEEKLKAINVEQDKLYKNSRDWLYAKQKERMVWPEVLREAAAKLKYREDFKDPVHHINFRDNYMTEVSRVYRIPRPLEPNEPDGVVIFPVTAMPHRDWGDITPTSTQMWNSMEDLWLLEPILQAILETNGGEKGSRYDAAVVAIESLKLVGGDRSKIGQSSDAQGGGGGGAGGPAGGGPAGMPGGAGGFGGPGGDSKGGGNNASFGTVSIDFKEADELGDAGGGSGGGGGGGGPAAGGPMAGGPMAGGGGDAKGGGGGGAAAEDTARRWIDDETSGLPYRTRGFKLSVVMDHRKVPDFYAQLTSSERSPWPIQILRMHIGRMGDSGPVGGEFGAGGGAVGAGLPNIGGGFPAGGFGGGAGLTPLGPNAPRAGAAGGGGGLTLPGGIAQPGERGGSGGNAPVNMDHMGNPFLARVTLVGLITLYNEPPKTEEPVAAATPPSGDPASGQPPTAGTPASTEPGTATEENEGTESPSGEMPAEPAEDAKPEEGSESDEEMDAPPAGEKETDSESDTESDADAEMKSDDAEDASETVPEANENEDEPEPVKTKK